ncbi:hypothetical protein [Hymenobacter guriensis]|uniref:XRE family transcriptional regulator n=1 Tax=Hymenobacter guriensis TaxID=2793065 RepID=A0ABS0L6K6_9BACT|nr:hypothetical protein [Hymenobacter guriensis]MBG8555711.1 hypothetical protein [Hymenobacter guriensis]
MSLRKKFARHRSFTSNLTSTHQVQARFGLTQQQLADVLGVSRTALAMDALGERLLPIAAVLGLDALRRQLPPPVGEALPLPVAESTPGPEDQKTLAMRLRGIAIADYPLQNQQERLQTRLEQAQARLQALPALHAAFPEERGQRWLNLFEEEARIWLEHDGSALLQLTLRRKVLAYEAAEIRLLLGEPQGQGLPPPVVDRRLHG